MKSTTQGAGDQASWAGKERLILGSCAAVAGIAAIWGLSVLRRRRFESINAQADVKPRALVLQASTYQSQEKVQEKPAEKKNSSKSSSKGEERFTEQAEEHYANALKKCSNDTRNCPGSPSCLDDPSHPKCKQQP